MEAQVNIQSIWEKRISPFSWIKRLISGGGSPSKPLKTPAIIDKLCNGITFGEQTIKSLIFSTDLALIENNDADAVLAVYPFSPSPRIMKSLIDFSDKPVICGVGGGITQGKVALEMAMAAEDLGAAAIIVNQPFKNQHIELIKRNVNIPIISSVSVSNISFRDRVNAGVDVFHVTGGQNTADIIRHISEEAPYCPIISTGGKTLESIRSSIRSGANAIVLTPPTNGELFKSIMNQYRKGMNTLRNNLRWKG